MARLVTRKAAGQLTNRPFKLLRPSVKTTRASILHTNKQKTHTCRSTIVTSLEEVVALYFVEQIFNVWYNNGNLQLVINIRCYHDTSAQYFDFNLFRLEDSKLSGNDQVQAMEKEVCVCWYLLSRPYMCSLRTCQFSNGTLS